MTPPEAIRVLDEITYKPGYFIEAWCEFDSVLIRVGTDVEDATGQKEGKIQLSLSYEMRVNALESFDRDRWIAFVYDRVEAFERHETMEWFKVNGKCWRDPHPERAKVGQ